MKFCKTENKESSHFTTHHHFDISSDTERKATKFVLRLGIQPNLKGYHLLITAICACIQNPELLHNFKNGLYPYIAQYYDSSTASIEHSIRFAIDKAYNTNPDCVQEVFYHKIGKPYISEVIALAVEKIAH